MKVAPKLRTGHYNISLVSAFNTLRARIIELDGCYMGDIASDYIMQALYHLAPVCDRKSTDDYTILTQRLAKYLFVLVPGSQASLIEMQWGEDEKHIPCNIPVLSIEAKSALVQRVTSSNSEWVRVQLNETALDWAKRLRAARVSLGQDMSRVFLSSRRKRFETTSAFSHFLRRHFDHDW